LAKKDWLREIYTPKQMYADYFLDHQNNSTSLMSFEMWKETQYPKDLERRKEQAKQFRSKNAQ